MSFTPQLKVSIMTKEQINQALANFTGTIEIIPEGVKTFDGDLRYINFCGEIKNGSPCDTVLSSYQVRKGYCCDECAGIKEGTIRGH